LLSACLIGLILIGSHAGAQVGSGGATTNQTQEEVIEDSLGRQSPRGTVLGFLAAGRDDNYELARQYLDTRQRANSAARLAQQLFVVLNARLQTRLAMVSERVDGSRTNPLKPNEEVIGSIESREGRVDVVVERIKRGGGPPVWLFTGSTLASVPELYDEVIASRSMLPPWFTSTRLAGVPIVEWLAVLILIPALYVGISFLNRLITPIIGFLWRRLRQPPDVQLRAALPGPVRLVLVALIGRWVLSALSFSLLIRQFWSLAASFVGIASIVWFLLLVSRWVEAYVRRHVPGAGTAAAIGLVRLIRRISDVIVVFAGMIAVLLRLGIDPTPALAGLGVGGIAVALAAQKTLENVIAGASLIFDQAVKVGDFLKMNEVSGTVDRIGLRSTRIRTMDRTIVSVPNSVLANASVETFSARDKFWFHPVIGLSYETTPAQLRTVLDGLRQMLIQHRDVDASTVRVRFFRLGASSLDLDISAYLTVIGWEQFLEVQEGLLLHATELVEKAGTRIALPSQTTYIRTQRTGEGDDESHHHAA